MPFNDSQVILIYTGVLEASLAVSLLLVSSGCPVFLCSNSSPPHTCAKSPHHARHLSPFIKQGEVGKSQAGALELEMRVPSPHLGVSDGPSCFGFSDVEVMQRWLPTPRYLWASEGNIEGLWEQDEPAVRALLTE